MPKAVLLSVQPFWAFLIIAEAMGWDIGKEKTVECRKNYPKDKEWNKSVKIYCSKNEKSFAKIPKKYQPLMQQFLGKIIGEFVCDRISDHWFSECDADIEEFADVQLSCLSSNEILEYGAEKELYFWHISDLVVYDKPKRLREFRVIDNEEVKECAYRERIYNNPDYTNGALLKGSYICNNSLPLNWCTKCHTKPLIRPPQSWCYVEDL